MSWTFTGSLIEVFGRPDLEDGYFNVYIDGNWVTQIDGHYPSITVDNDLLCGIAMYQAKVGYGTHTITIVNTGTRDPNAAGTFTQIDLFVAFP
jgi:hypothetical protein